ncbi:MAG: hypothetical protein KF745_10610 [Phycisphaeraceae bacterium]|nr:hypothetical protein [Phycisphaeraceae bacterium]
MAYDASQGVTLLFGGADSTGTRGDTWSWNGVTWTQIGGIQPPPREAAKLVYDPARQVSVLYGGSEQFGLGTFHDDTWELSGGTWTLRTAGTPSARDYFGMAYDPARRVTVLFGGQQRNTQNYNETWELVDVCSGATIGSQPLAQSSCRSGSARFTVVASGEDTLHYRWQVQVAPSGAWQSLAGEPIPLACGGFASVTPQDSPTVEIHLFSCPDVHHYGIRCIVWTALGCPEIASDTATYTICHADFNCDYDLNPVDIAAFVKAWLAGRTTGELDTDFDHNGAVEPADIAAFVNEWLRALTNGC